MQNKKTIILVAGFVVLAVISFYAGTQYANSKNNNPMAQNQGAFGARGFGNVNVKGMRGNGGVFGKVIAKDATSITVELSTPGQGTDVSQTGTGSKIVFYTDKTTVMKTGTGTTADVAIGSQVSVNGTANPDGSVIAQTITLRPNMPTVPKQ
ncbi:MAG: hypothetical protein WCI41_00450 [bacterium]